MKVRSTVASSIACNPSVAGGVVGVGAIKSWLPGDWLAPAGPARDSSKVGGAIGLVAEIRPLRVVLQQIRRLFLRTRAAVAGLLSGNGGLF